jgi:hypothetical protein
MVRLRVGRSRISGGGPKLRALMDAPHSGRRDRSAMNLARGACSFHLTPYAAGPRLWAQEALRLLRIGWPRR